MKKCTEEELADVISEALDKKCVGVALNINVHESPTITTTLLQTALDILYGW